MKVRVDAGVCAGFGVCLGLCPEVFELQRRRLRPSCGSARCHRNSRMPCARQSTNARRARFPSVRHELAVDTRRIMSFDD